MNLPTNIALLALAAVVAVAAERAILSPASRPIEAETEITSDALEGRVLSVDPTSSDGEAGSLARKARVKLVSGEIVRASIGGCVVAPGQSARLLRYGSGSSAIYVLAGNGKDT
jgi:hypothetical protein